jgi:hypothetical protein
MRRVGRYVIIVFGIVVLLVGCGGAPSSEDVVTAFEDEGLEVGDSYPVEEDEVWQAFEHPENYEDGTRFEIPSLGVGAGGRVFTFDSEDDLNEMRALYEDMAETPGVSSHLYQEDLVLLQVNGELPKAQADAYGDVLSQEV